MNEILKDLLVGINLPPFIVANARAFVVALALAIVGAAITFVGGYDFTILGLPQGVSVLIGPALVYVLKSVEGALDQNVTPNQNNLGVDYEEVSP